MGNTDERLKYITDTAITLQSVIDNGVTAELDEMKRAAINLVTMAWDAGFKQGITSAATDTWESFKQKHTTVSAVHENGCTYTGTVRMHHNGGMCLQTPGKCYPIDKLGAPWKVDSAT